MNYELIALAVFIALLTVFLIVKRKKLEVQKIVWPLLYFVLYKTKLGLNAMDKISKRKKLMKAFGVAGVWVGFVGMGFISFMLIWNIIHILTTPAVDSGVGIVLPIPGVKGIFYVPFFYWIISILVVASVHEFSHGMIARFNKVKIKSSGFAFLGVLLPIIPAAFVEPDEKDLKKKKSMKQLQVFAAGPLSNIILGFIFLGIFVLLAPPIAGQFDVGVNITGIEEDGAISNTSIAVGEKIVSINNQSIIIIEDFITELNEKKPGDQINMETDKSNYSITLGANPDNPESPYLGIDLAKYEAVKPEVAEKFGTFIPGAELWIVKLIWWLYLLNFGIGIFNLVPVGPIDGGRMVYVSLREKYKKDKALKIAGWISLVFLALIVLNVLIGFFV